MADLIVNHVSAKSIQFQDYFQKGKDSKYVSFFLKFGSNAKYGFILATVFAALLFVGFLLNMIFKPTHIRLAKLNESEYQNLDSL